MCTKKKKPNLDYLERMALKYGFLSLLGYVYDLRKEEEEQNKKRTE